MTILEKNDIKMNVGNKEQENFDLLLNNEKEKFEKDFNKNYSKKTIEEYSLKHFNINDSCLKLLLGNLVFMILTGLFLKYPINDDPIYRFLIFLFLVAGCTAFHFLVLLSPVKKLINKRSCNKEKNIKIIKRDIFSDITPDNYFLKHFINAYGEKAIKKILIDKESITYGDIENYITEFKEAERINNNQKSKIDKVDQIVKCISALQ